MAAPSLHEIAAMPRSQAVAAIRRFYDRDWHRPVSDEPEEYEVAVEYSYRTEGSTTLKVEARSGHEAEKLARKVAEEEIGGDDFEIWSIHARREAEPFDHPSFPLLEGLH